MIEEIKSAGGYLGCRFICSKCHGEVNLIDEYCKWCGDKFPHQLNKKVTKSSELLIK